MMKFRKLDSFYLKIIGMITMVIDHIGFYLLPQYPILRIIGRISFPIFAFTTAESMQYSKHKERYIIGLLTLDIIFCLVAYIATGDYWDTVFSCLGMSALTIYLLQHNKKFIKCLSILPIIYVYLGSTNMVPFKVQYGLYGLVMIVGFYLCRIFIEKYADIKYRELNIDFNDLKNSDNFYRIYTTLSCLFLLGLCLISYYASTYLTTYLPCGYMSYKNQSYAFLALPFILLYSGKLGFNNKAFKIICYLFYPVHILLIFGISFLI